MSGRKVTYPLPGTQDCLAVEEEEEEEEEEEAEVPLAVVVVVFPLNLLMFLRNCFSDVGWWGAGRDLTYARGKI